jgi:hypothetical protein
VSTPGLVTLIGSGEVSAGMVKVHRQLLEDLGRRGPRPVFLETPAGFELGAEAIAARFVEYFRTSLSLDLRLARYHSREDPPAEQADALEALAQADYIIAGPGSPTYAVEHLRGTPILATVLQRWQAGAQLVFASAATIALGRHALPVYEIYKVGRPLSWAAGLDIFGDSGIELAIIPHWDNAEGGTHDTRACFMGMDRFSRLRTLLPESAVVLGVDEHTAVSLDLAAGQATIRARPASPCCVRPRPCASTAGTCSRWTCCAPSTARAAVARRSPRPRPSRATPSAPPPPSSAPAIFRVDCASPPKEPLPRWRCCYSRRPPMPKRRNPTTTRSIHSCGS